MKEKIKTFFLWVLAVGVFVAACGYSGNGSPENPVAAKPMIIQSTDGSRFQCQGIESDTYGGYTILSVFDCQEIKK